MRNVFLGAARIAACFALALFLGHAAWAQQYPTRPVRLVVPFPPGGSTDILARLVAQKLSEDLGQTVLVDNRPGAGGTLGANLVAKSLADGYTLLMGSSGPISISPSLMKKLPYDPTKDYAAISLIATIPTMLVVNPSVPVKTVAELVALAKSKPGKMNFASTGNGATPHLAAELFKFSAGVDIVHVPYKGSAPAVADLLGGQVDLMFEQVPAVLPHVKAGKLRAIAVSSATRSAAMPELPTIAESGLPGFEVSSWFGILAPTGTPPEIINRLNGALVRIMANAQVRETLAAQGAEAVGTTPQAFAATIGSEIPKWASVVKRAGVTVD